MFAEQLLRRRPGLLVSVRSADEARAALAGGADVIDVKEPDRGPLGAADWETIAEIVRVIDGRSPVTAAAGELLDLWPVAARGTLRPLPAGVSLVKIGLAGCGAQRDWTRRWRRTAAACCDGHQSRQAEPVAVIYADWLAAGSPPPEEICRAAVDLGCRFVLLDTWNKSAGNLFDFCPLRELRFFVERTHAHGFAVVLAGSLSGANLLAAAELRPHLVAVRGAACEAGRSGNVSRKRVQEICRSLAARAAGGVPQSSVGAGPEPGAAHWHKEFS